MTPLFPVILCGGTGSRLWPLSRASHPKQFIEFGKCSLLADAGYRPYYMYRQKGTLQNLENIGWAKPGFECLYNIYIMEEVHTILSAGAGGSTKLVIPGQRRGKIERIFNYKYPTEYIDRFDTILARKEGVKQFYDQYPSCGESARPQAHGGV